MSAKKLSPEEIELALTKIIKKYDEYIYRFFKFPKVKTAFEERYFSVIKNGLDMARFLSTEISVIEELIKKEEDKLTTEIAPEQKTEKKEGYADRVLKELKAKIEKYPEIRIHKDANPEIRRLLGALGDLDQKYMPPLQDALKNTNYAFNTQIMMNLDAQLRSLSGGLEGIPARLTRYLTQLNVFPRDYKALDREEKAYILEASFFLHDLIDILKQVKPAYYSMSRDEIEKMNRVRSYLEGVIEDFRLKDFKRRSV